MCQCWPTSKNLFTSCADTGCSLEDLPETMYDRDEWSERASERERGGANPRLDDDDDDDDIQYARMSLISVLICL